MEITIQSDRKDLIDTSYELLTEKVIFGAGRRKGFDKKLGGIKGLMKGVLGYDEYRIEVPKEGVIIYQKWDIPSLGYLGIVKLEGFNEENSKKFQELKNTLEKIASSEDIVKLNYELFPGDFKDTSVEEVKKQLKFS